MAVFQFFQHAGMNTWCRCQDGLRGGDVIGFTEYIRYTRTGLFADQAAGGYVPGLEGQLPESIETTGCHVT